MNTEKSSRIVVKRARCRSIRIRIGGRIMLLTWRPRVRIAGLLFALLRRSWRTVFGGIAALSFAMPAAAAAIAVNALPTGATVAAGQAVVSQNGNRMNIVQGSANAILNWSSFNIGSAAAVNFQQPDATSATLNRVTGNDPSALLGTLTANGKVWLINPAGIMVGQGAKIDVAGFVASTMTVRDDDFLANRLNFRATPGAGTVQNAGAIATHDGGSVYLVGTGVENSGLINAPGGEVLLAAGQSVQLLNTGTPGVKVEITGADGIVTNLGQILSDAGRIGLVGVLVKNSGVLNASSVHKDGGRIFLKASDNVTVDGASRIESSGLNGGAVAVEGHTVMLDGSILAGGRQGGRIDAVASALFQTGSLDVSGGQGGSIALQAKNLLQAGQLIASGNAGAGGAVEVSGHSAIVQPASAKVDASGTTSGGAIVFRSELGTTYLSGQMASAGDTGGRIELLGDQVVLAAATADAHGNHAGGSVLVGGDEHGSNGAVQNARNTTVGSASVIDVSAIETGNGGNAVVWSDQHTVFGGHVAARGGSQGGDGGRVEVSGKELLSFGGLVDAGASNGKPGTLLLDPKNIVIDASAGAGINYVSLNGPGATTATSSTGYGGAIQFATELTNGNIAVALPNDSFGADKAGAVYVFNGGSGALVSALYGSQANDHVGLGRVTALNNGNFVIGSPSWANGSAINAGAVTWGSGTTGISGAVSTGNSLVGSQTNDQVGTELDPNGGSTSGIKALSNGNYVVASTSWANGAASNAGAVTWGSGTIGISGAVSVANSLVGSQANDFVGSANYYSSGTIYTGGGITALNNGNYVVASPRWANGAAINAGAVTWASGTTGISGAVSTANSLVGSQGNDSVGIDGVMALINGNYVVGSSSWANGAATSAGAVTWSSGTTGIIGVVAAANSLVGSQAGDRLGSPFTSAGSFLGGGGVAALSNGNYVVSSPGWANGAATNAGAVSWGSGATGISGSVSTANSLVGSQTNDRIGNGPTTALSNGNYVVGSPNWSNGAATDAGAVTWGSGTTGTSGTVSTANSLVGSQAYDLVGNGNITALSNGNYVVASSNWANGSATNAGAVTWGSGTAGIRGVVSPANSLVGSQVDDQVGYGGITALGNGNYVVDSRYWANGAVRSAGAVTWGSGAVGIAGAISASNSLVGSQVNDSVGDNGITALSNGNYVVDSFSWANGAAQRAGAITWGSGTTGISGTVSAANSLVGSGAYDMVGSEGVTALSNGNYVVGSSSWTNGVGTGAGAVTWGNGTTGISGAVSAANSLVGSQTNDSLSANGITALSNGNYVVASEFWANGAATNAGAVTWGSGTTGISGAVSTANSLVGSQTNDRVGSSGITAMGNGNFVVSSGKWHGNTGRVDLGLPGPASAPSGQTYALAPGADVTMTPASITAITSTGTALVLQANNDITLAARSDIVSNNPPGNGGNLTLQAGRSISLNSSIATGNGNLTLIANDSVANGVVDAYRDPGAASITMAALTTIAAGSGNISMEVRDGAGLTYNTAGGILIGGSITANAFSLRGIDITLADGASLAASALTGDSIVLDAGSGNFTNSSGGATPFALAGTARSLVYTSDSATALLGGMTDKPVYGKTFTTYTPDLVTQSGNRILYANAGTPYIVTINSFSRDYGDANPVLTTDPVGPSVGFQFASRTRFSSSMSSGDGTFIGLPPSGDVITGSAALSTAATSRSNVGVYSIDGVQGSLVSDYNLGFTFVPGALTITPRPITVSADARNMNYGDAVPALTRTISAGNLVNGDTLSGNLATVASSSANIGVYPISLGSLTAGGNYALSYVASDVTIGPRPLTIIAQTQAKVYGDADPVLAFTSGALVNGDTLAGSLARTAGENVGSYGITQGSLSAGSNYAITYTGNPLVVTPAVLSVTANNQGRIYGDANPALTSTESGFKLSDTAASVLSGSLATTAGGASNIGNYPITQGSLSANPNYVVSFSNGNMAIAARALSVVAAAETKVYGDADPVLAFTSGALVNGDTLAGSLARTAGENVGSYGITQGSLRAGSNYAITYTGNPLVVTPAALSVTANNQGRIYGDANLALTSIASGFKLSDTAGSVLSGSLATTASGVSNIGNYPITQGSLIANPNYVVSFSNGNMAIVARALSVVATPETKVYGDADPVLAFTSGALVNRDTLAGSLARTAGENVGSYGINQGSLSAGSNYAIAYTGNPLVVTPAALSVTANNQGRIYGDANPALTSIASGFKLSDTAGSVLIGSLATTASGVSNIGNYAITQGSLIANPNYVVSFSNGNMAIVARALSVVATPETKVYGDADPVLAFTSGALVNGDTLAGSLARTAGENVGSYGINQGSLSAGSNYAINYTGNPLVVTPAALTYVATPASRNAGEVNPVFGGTVTGFRFGESLASIASTGPSFTSSAGAGSAAGQYPINGNGVILDSKNYQLVQAPSNANALTITGSSAVVPASSSANQSVVAAMDSAMRAVWLGKSNQRVQLSAAMTMVSANTAAVPALDQPTRTDPLGSAGGSIGEFGGAAGASQGSPDDQSGSSAARGVIPRTLPRCTFLIGQQ